METPEQRIKEALHFALNYGGFDGAHHKSWCIDQMVRILTGTPEEYAQFVADACNGDDGPHTYDWDAGSPP